ncbi:MAG: M18 family aminopeptidase [Erysipelotrichaceae bacterium]|nr:M18 family aminopeptidase [Erysipelotrichaceae bacterium]
MTKAKEMVKFLNSCHSIFQAVDVMEKQLSKAGFKGLGENEYWQLEKGGSYYVTRNNSSIIAFRIPQDEIKSSNIVVSHSDSPCFKIKPVAELNNPHYKRLNVEVYGGAILPSWLDRPLSIAGRALVRKDGVITSCLVDFDENMAIIPNVAIHQNREINSGYKYNPQVDLIPLWGLDDGEESLLNKIAAELKIAREDILSYDLFIYNRDEACLWGRDKEFISSPRIDDLACAFTSMQGIMKAASRDSLNIMGVFDNEEVGSMTRQGMASDFLANVIERVFSCFGLERERIMGIMANSFMISADNGHAVHPNHPELYDQANQAYMNKGIVIKRCASQSYVTDAVSEAVIRELCERAKVPYQYFANRSDVRGGGTQGAIAGLHIPSMAADIGLAQLAMHSSFETAGSKDVDHLIKLFEEFYQSSIYADNGNVRIEK